MSFMPRQAVMMHVQVLILSWIPVEYTKQVPAGKGQPRLPTSLLRTAGHSVWSFMLRHKNSNQGRGSHDDYILEYAEYQTLRF